VATTQQPSSAAGPQAVQAAQQAAQQPQPAQQAQQPPAQQKKKRLRNPFRRNQAKRDAKANAKKAAHGAELDKGRGDLLGHQVINQRDAGGQIPKHQAAMPAAKAVDPTESGSASELAENFTVFSDPIDAVGGAVGGTGNYIGIRADYEDATPGHAAEKDDDAKDAGAEHQSTVLGTTSAGLGAATSGISTVAGTLAAVDNFRQFRAMLKANKAQAGSVNGLTMTDTFLQGTGNALQAGTSGLSAASSVGGVGAGIASAQDASNDVASTAASAFGGLGDAIGAVGGSVQLLVSGARLVIGTVNNIRNPDEANWSATATDSIGMLKGFLSTANSTVSAVSGFLQIAGHAANLANALPLVGATVNICIQFLDIAIQAINFVKALVKMIKAIQQSKKMKGKSEAATAGSDEQKMLTQLSEVNTKRYKRQLLPLISSVVNGVADCISIGGSVLNIVGVATSPAYGAGVAIMAAGYGASATAGLVKLGTALAGPVQKFVRTQKQFGRDVAANEKSGGWRGTLLKKTHIIGAYNTEKSSDKKDQRYLASVNSIFDMVAALPDGYTQQESARFEHAHDVIKATGVSTKQLYAASTQEDATRLLMDALKKRE
jgi:hypothetical protein